MTADAVLEKVLSVVRAGAHENLLADVDSLAGGIEAAGWVRAVGGGWWVCPGEPAWSLLSSDYAPNLAVFFVDEDPATVFAIGQAIARRLDRPDEGLTRHGLDPGWPSWSHDDVRWAEWDGLGADWVMWDGGPARFSLNVRPSYQPGRVRDPPNLHFQIERIDTPPEGLPVDVKRARRIAQSGSPTARWYLAGELELPEDVIDALRQDREVAVVAAIEAGEEMRRAYAAGKAFGPMPDAS